MAWHPTGRDLLYTLLKHGLLSSDPRLVLAWQQVDRALFVPQRALPLAYADHPQLIGHGATISAPHMHAAQLTCLQRHLTPGARVLDVGSGTGIMLALAAHLVCEGGGRVVGLEHIPALAASSLLHLRASGARLGAWLEAGQVQVHAADGRAGWAAEGPYNAIHVGAAAPALPSALLQQLAPGGRMVIPVGREEQELLVVDKAEDGTLTQSTVMAVRFVPLCDRAEQEALARAEQEALA